VQRMMHSELPAGRCLLRSYLETQSIKNANVGVANGTQCEKTISNRLGRRTCGRCDALQFGRACIALAIARLGCINHHPNVRMSLEGGCAPSQLD
jgi:hypothetical protein